MRTIEFNRYGSAEVLHICNREIPQPGDTEICVKTVIGTVASTDCSFRAGNPFIVRFYLGLHRPKTAILGCQLSGTVAAVGKDVTRFQVGDRVLGAIANGLGAYADYVCLPEDGAQIVIPDGMDYVQAACLCEGLTALPFLRDHGGIQAGQQVLVNGASGAVGSAAVQIARHYGAEVTGVCSSRNVDLVRRLGASHVIDYTQTDFTCNGKRYDIVFDAVGKSSVAACRRVLAAQGVYLSTVITCNGLFSMLRTKWRRGQKAIVAATGLRPAQDQIADLEILADMYAAGKYQSVIDRSYPMSQAAVAHAFVDKGHKRGNVILRFDREQAG